MAITRTKGFSLVELLIATTLLSLVMFSGYYAYGLYSKGWDKRVNQFWQRSKNGISVTSVSNIISAMLPYVVFVEADSNKSAILFEGSKRKVSFVSEYTLFSHEISLVTLSIVQQLDGSFSLIYQERSLDSHIIKRLPVFDGNFDATTVLLEGLEYGEFKYFGWENLAQALKTASSQGLSFGEAGPALKMKWYDTHSAALRQVSPVQIEFKYKAHHHPDETTLSLPLARESEQTLISMKTLEY